MAGGDNNGISFDSQSVKNDVRLGEPPSVAIESTHLLSSKAAGGGGGGDEEMPMGNTNINDDDSSTALQWAVPIVLVVTASLGSVQEFRSYPRRIDLGNVMVMQLNELKLWWMSLSMYQKQLPHNKDKLVMSVEKIIVAEMEASFGSSKSAVEEE